MTIEDFPVIVIFLEQQFCEQVRLNTFCDGMLVSLKVKLPKEKWMLSPQYLVLLFGCSDSIQFLIIVFLYAAWCHPSIFWEPLPGLLYGQWPILCFQPNSSQVDSYDFYFFTLALSFVYLTESVRLRLALHQLLYRICVTYGTPCCIITHQTLRTPYQGDRGHPQWNQVSQKCVSIHILSLLATKRVLVGNSIYVLGASRSILSSFCLPRTRLSYLLRYITLW